MKYIIRRIFIGVSIGFILFVIKSFDVFAYGYSYSSDFSHFTINHKWDICLYQNDNLICQDAFERTDDVRTLQNGTNIYTTKNNEYLFLREYSIHMVFNNTKNLTGDYILLPNLKQIFYKVDNQEVYQWRIYDNLLWNNSPVAVEFTFSDDTKQLINTRLGITNTYTGTLNSSNFKSINSMIYLSNNGLSSRSIKEITVIYQSGYNYNGLLDNMVILPQFVSGRNFTQYTNLYKNNGYLAYIPPNFTLYIDTKKNAGASELIDGFSGTSSNFQLQNYTPTINEINENLSNLQREFILNESISGSVIDDETNNAFTSGFDTALSNFNDILDMSLSGSGTSFKGFLSSIIIDPISHIQTSLNNDIFVNNQLSTSLCFKPHQEGVTDRGWIKLWPKYDWNNGQDNTYYQFQLPCMINTYHAIHYQNYYVLGSSPVNTDSFYFIWVIIQHFFLYYWFVLICLDTFKYAISNSHAQIEVIDL